MPSVSRKRTIVIVLVAAACGAGAAWGVAMMDFWSPDLARTLHGDPCPLFCVETEWVVSAGLVGAVLGGLGAALLGLGRRDEASGSTGEEPAER